MIVSAASRCPESGVAGWLARARARALALAAGSQQLRSRRLRSRAARASGRWRALSLPPNCRIPDFGSRPAIRPPGLPSFPLPAAHTPPPTLAAASNGFTREIEAELRGIMRRFSGLRAQKTRATARVFTRDYATTRMILHRNSERNREGYARFRNDRKREAEPHKLVNCDSNCRPEASSCRRPAKMRRGEAGIQPATAKCPQRSPRRTSRRRPRAFLFTPTHTPATRGPYPCSLNLPRRSQYFRRLMSPRHTEPQCVGRRTTPTVPARKVDPCKKVATGSTDRSTPTAVGSSRAPRAGGSSLWRQARVALDAGQRLDLFAVAAAGGGQGEIHR